MTPTPFTYLSICSGIEAASVAWEPLGWKPCAFAEIEKFPSAVLAHHWPEVPNLGDMTKYHEWPDTLRPHLIVGGTPCQAFSVAGLRKGLADPRGNLTLTFLALLARYLPEWLVWENVPGVLSDQTGAFGAFLGGLGELGYGTAYRVLDAQYFGVAQRRRRVFVVGHLGDWRRAAAVLFERESLRGDSPPSQEKRQGSAYDLAPCLAASGRGFERTGDTRGQECVIPEVITARMVAFGEYECDDSASTLKMRDYKDATDLVAHTLRGEGFDASEDGTERGTPIAPVTTYGIDEEQNAAEELMGCLKARTAGGGFEAAVAYGFNGDQSEKTRSMGEREENAPTLRADGPAHVAIAFAQNTRDEVREMAVVGALAAEPGMKQTSYIRQQMQVRRLTPRECERLQGFPDDHTLIPWRGKTAPDGPRYKALGNSMAVPVMRWIGQRIAHLKSTNTAPAP
jgi:DNA (cytosine-5)-methyltransferase 1